MAQKTFTKKKDVTGPAGTYEVVVTVKLDAVQRKKEVHNRVLHEEELKSFSFHTIESGIRKNGTAISEPLVTEHLNDKELVLNAVTRFDDLVKQAYDLANKPNKTELEQKFEEYGFI